LSCDAVVAGVAAAVDAKDVQSEQQVQDHDSWQPQPRQILAAVACVLGNHEQQQHGGRFEVVVVAADVVVRPQ
jgi:hypothetical protein